MKFMGVFYSVGGEDRRLFFEEQADAAWRVTGQFYNP